MLVEIEPRLISTPEYKVYYKKKAIEKFQRPPLSKGYTIGSYTSKLGIQTIPLKN